MTMQWNGDKIIVEIEKATAETLLKLAVTFQIEFMHRLNVSNPRPHDSPSVPGEYLKKRTGILQANIQISPTNADEVRRTGATRVAYGANAYYGAIWDARGSRKGMKDCLKEIKSQLEAIAGSIKI